MAAILGGSGETNVLGEKGGATSGPAGSIFISQGECEEAVRKLTGDDPPHDAQCSPG